jgi:hypothetical protein
MASIHSLAKSGSFDSVTLNRLSDILDNTWVEVGHAFVGQSQNLIDEARAAMAKCLLYYAANGQRDPATLKALALQALAGAYPHIKF